MDGGDLFAYIRDNGALSEELAMKFFRQMLSAVGHYHAFRICHRDLKPENILMTGDGTIKIADFGMAALHQEPDHKLATPCGSMHYAAPEVIEGNAYRGDKSDVWSLGIILFALLAGSLPFDSHNDDYEEATRETGRKILDGRFTMPPHFSHGARDLIFRILKRMPDTRLTIPQIWRHPLIRQYDFLDDLSAKSQPKTLDTFKNDRPVQRQEDIEIDILRHLKALWHQLDEKTLIERLLSKESNEQKMFYCLFSKFRDDQLENYEPAFSFSASDYHHIQPKSKLNKLPSSVLTTCEFVKPAEKGQSRQVSRFTLVSNDRETVKSYDPYKASKPQNLVNPHAEFANIVVHREVRSASDNTHQKPLPGRLAPPTITARSSSYRAVTSSSFGALRPPKRSYSRSSFASSTGSRNGSAKRAMMAHKRGVVFPRQRSAATFSDQGSVAGRHRGRRDPLTSESENRPPASQQVRSKKPSSQPARVKDKTNRKARVLQEEVIKFSDSLAKDCDEAFNRPSESPALSTDSYQGERLFDKSYSSRIRTTEYMPSSPPAFEMPPRPKTRLERRPIDERPLPRPPPRTASLKQELLNAKQEAEIRRASGKGAESPRYLDRMVSHLDRLIEPSSPSQPRASDRRVASAPAPRRTVQNIRSLESINESKLEDTNPDDWYDEPTVTKLRVTRDKKGKRMASAPEPSNRNWGNIRDPNVVHPMRFTNDHSIRPVAPSSTGFDVQVLPPAKPPAPLQIRKRESYDDSTRTKGLKKQQTGQGSLHQQFVAGHRSNNGDLAVIDEHSALDSHGTPEPPKVLKKKVSGWFKKDNKSFENLDESKRNSQCSTASGSSSSQVGTSILDSMPSIPPPPNLKPPQLNPKKSFFGRLLHKKEQKPRFQIEEDTIPTIKVFDDNNKRKRDSEISKRRDQPPRQIETQQSWFAKLLRVKPATRIVCFAVNKRRARQEVTFIFKDWARYGMENVQVDKARDMVFGTVNEINYLAIKPVAVAAEFMLLYEHGKKAHMSIGRFTQEIGAATSFNRVMDALESAFTARGMMVTDESTKRMMMETFKHSGK